MKYRKKPVVIEAFQLMKEDFAVQSRWPQWLYEAWTRGPGKGGFWFEDNYTKCFVGTLEGTSYSVAPGAYIVRGVKGEIYPCDKEIFEMTYEKVNE